MTKAKNHVPDSWAPTSIGEVCIALQYGYTASASEEPCGPRFLRITDIQDGQVQWPKVPYCEISEEQISKYELHAGDIVFARTGGTVGKSFILTSVPERSVFASYLIRLSGYPGIERKFLYYFFQSASYWEQIGLKKGGLQGNVNATTLSSLELPICSLNEQQRIVGKIEELLSELDKGIENLKLARKQLKVYRQAVLKHAFEGKLTEKWREENKDQLQTPDGILESIREAREQQYEASLADWRIGVKDWEESGKNSRKPSKPRKPKDVDSISSEELERLPTVPEAWKYDRFGSVIEGIEAGKSFKCDEREPENDEVGVAKVSAVSWAEYDEHESKTCSDPARVDQSLFIHPGNFLFSRANTIELVGACVIARDVTKNVMLSDKTLRLVLHDRYKRYFLQYLRSQTGRNQIMSRSTGNQDSMRNIGQDRIRSIIVPICSEAEMLEIDNQLAARFTITDALELEINIQILRSRALRQSILKRAFSGRLVDQDPDDEPASELLARIKAEKEEQEKTKRASKKKAKKKSKRKDAA